MADTMADECPGRTGWAPLDLTKVWPHADCPVIELGVLEAQQQRLFDNIAAAMQGVPQSASMSPSARINRRARLSGLCSGAR